MAIGTINRQIHPAWLPCAWRKAVREAATEGEGSAREYTSPLRRSLDRRNRQVLLDMNYEAPAHAADTDVAMRAAGAPTSRSKDAA